jgi:hypothetical protein
MNLRVTADIELMITSVIEMSFSTIKFRYSWVIQRRKSFTMVL